MRTFCFAVLVSSALIVTSPASGQELPTSLSIKVSYYRCLDPMPPICVAASDNDKSTSCPDCTKWEKATFSNTAALDDTVIQQRYPDRANLFLSTAAHSIYDTKYPSYEGGSPFVVRDFWQNAKAGGWIDVTASDTRDGALVVGPEGIGGVVLHDADKRSKVEVLYPSAKKQGAVTEGKLVYLIESNRERFLFPRTVLEDHAGIELNGVSMDAAVEP